MYKDIGWVPEGHIRESCCSSFPTHLHTALVGLPCPNYLVKVENNVQLADISKIPVQNLHKQMDHLRGEGKRV